MRQLQCLLWVKSGHSFFELGPDQIAGYIDYNISMAGLPYFVTFALAPKHSDLEARLAELERVNPGRR